MWGNARLLLENTIYERERKMQLNWRKSESLQRPLEIDAALTKNGIYLRRNITEVQTGDEKEISTKFIYDEVLLPNTYRYNILDMDEYKAKLLEQFKSEQKINNAAALANVQSIDTTYGKVLINTPVGTIDSVVSGLLNLVNITKQNLPAGSFRTYINGISTPSPELTPSQVASLFVEVFKSINELDKKYKNYESLIDNTATLDDVIALEFEY